MSHQVFLIEFDASRNGFEFEISKRNVRVARPIEQDSAFTLEPVERNFLQQRMIGLDHLSEIILRRSVEELVKTHPPRQTGKNFKVGLAFAFGFDHLPLELEEHSCDRSSFSKM